MAAPRIYGDDVRASIDDLINTQRLTSPQVRQIIRERHGVDPSEARIRGIAKSAKRERNPLEDLPQEQQMQRILNGIVTALHSQIDRINTDEDADHSDELLRLAKTAREIEPMLKPATPAKPQAQPTTLMGTLARNTAGAARGPVAA